MINNLIWEAFERFIIYKDNKEIKFTELEKDIINNFENDEKGNYILIQPKENDYLLLLATIYSAIKISYFNIFRSESDILDVIKEGEVIKYNKSLCIYEGRNNDKLKIKFKDGIIMLPITLRYKLSKYYGDARVLNKMPTKILTATGKTKDLLAEIMNINIDEICKVSKKSILIIENKQRINKLIKSIQIKVGCNEKVALTEVFPMAYYSSDQNVYHFKGNNKKEDPIVKFTSKSYIANDLSKKIKSIDSVIYLPKRITLDDLEDLKNIERKKNVNNVLSIVNPIDMEKQINNEYLQQDFRVKNIKISINSNFNPTYFNERQYLYFKNNINRPVNINIIESKISEIRKKINKKCISLARLFENDTEILSYVISARKITKRIVTIPIPLNNFDEMIIREFPKETTNKLLNKLKDLSESLKKRQLALEIRNDIEFIYNMIEELYYILLNNNIKWNELRNIITSSNSQNILIATDNKIIRLGVKSYIRKFFPYRKNVKVGRNKIINNEIIYDRVIFSGLLEENLYNNYRPYNAKEVVCIFYKFEKQFFNYLEKKYESFTNNSNIISENNNEIELICEKEEELEEIKREVELENRIEEFIITGYTNTGTEASGANSSLIECNRVLKFSDGRRAFISKQFNSYELDEDREEIIIRKPTEIAIGQILLFINDINKDIVESTLKGMLTIPKIKEIYEKAYNDSKVWKNILKKYMLENDFTYNDLAREIKRYGVSRTNATIRGWLIDSTVAPQDIEAFKAIAQMTKDEEFIRSYENIFEACNIVRSFQIKVRKAIAKKMLSINISDESDEIDKIIMENCKNDFDKVIKVEVEKVFNIEKKVPAYLTNTILEE